MNPATAVSQSLTSSILLLDASVKSGTAAVTAVGQTATAIGDTVENANKITTAATHVTVESAKTTQKFVEAIGDNSKELTDASAKSAVASLKSLTDQITNTNDITTTLMKTTNQSLQKSSEHISDSISDASQITSTITNTALRTFKFSFNLIETIFSVIEKPFASIQAKIIEIKNSNDSPNTKFDKIKNEIKNDFKVTSSSLHSEFMNQIENMITDVDELLNLYKQLGCKKIWNGTYECNIEIQTKSNAIIQLKPIMKLDKKTCEKNITAIFESFNKEVVSIPKLGITNDNLENKINEMEEKLITVQAKIIADATNQLEQIIKKFNEKYITAIKNNIDQLTDSLVDVIKTPHSKKEEQVVGGKKMRKSRQTKRNKKSKKSKTRRSK